MHKLDLVCMVVFFFKHENHLLKGIFYLYVSKKNTQKSPGILFYLVNQIVGQ